MPTELKLWKVENNRLRVVEKGKLDLESQLEEWLLRDITLVSKDLLVIGHQVPTAHTGKIDVLAMDSAGNLVILELKRDKTPRVVVAQALDYASWVQELDRDDVEKIANDYLKPESIEQAFRRKFNDELPEVTNERHRIYIVAASLDDATERIITYLSETHDVDINAATFSYFPTSDGKFVGRSFLLDESEVEGRAVKKSKRRPNRTLDEFRDLAENAGVLSAYKTALKLLAPLFDGKRPTRNNVSLLGQMRGELADEMSKHAIIGIYPAESNKDQGLAMTVDLDRCAEYFSVTVQQLKAAMGPKSEHANTYRPDSTYFFNDETLSALASLLDRAEKTQHKS